MAKRTARQNQFHRSQIGRAQRYIRRNFDQHLTLAKIAREAGSSCYHFARVFMAYTGETPFDFLRRIRLATSLRMLDADLQQSVTDIALDVGYETPSAFNKIFQKTLKMSPREFRKLGKESRFQVLYDLSKPRISKEIIMNLTPGFNVVNRPLLHYVFLEKQGPFSEIAPPAWDEMFGLLRGQVDEHQIVAHLGLSTIDKTKTGEEAMIYEAGVAIGKPPEKPLHGLRYREIEGGNYARFVLKGPYSQIWVAFDQIFRTLAEGSVELRPDYCIENYLNDPKEVSEDQLLTELLVPVA